jgi:hypothetical protein
VFIICIFYCPKKAQEVTNFVRPKASNGAIEEIRGNDF